MYEYKAKLVRVIDGDTLELDIDCGFHVHVIEKVRLIGIDTPETYGVKKDSEEYALGKAATEFVKERLSTVDSFMIKTQKDKQGKYGRYLAEVFIDGKSLNLQLLEEGHAETM